MVIRAITALLVCQLIGEALVVGLEVPIPGPVLGMVILFVGLVIKGGLPKTLESTSETLLSHLSLLFVPAGVGVVTHLSLVQANWLPLTAALIVSTLVSIAITGWLMTKLSKPDAGTSDSEARS